MSIFRHDIGVVVTRHNRLKTCSEVGKKVVAGKDGFICDMDLDEPLAYNEEVYSGYILKVEYPGKSSFCEEYVVWSNGIPEIFEEYVDRLMTSEFQTVEELKAEKVMTPTLNILDSFTTSSEILSMSDSPSMTATAFSSVGGAMNFEGLKEMMLEAVSTEFTEMNVIEKVVICNVAMAGFEYGVEYLAVAESPSYYRIYDMNGKTRLMKKENFMERKGEANQEISGKD